ncbi:hypothetical protein KVQ82_16580 [Pseudomonas sp. AO-1]|uniref:hypothetical protein n=1 Tax=Pseudomonas sp. AO-1 TaxID=2855434 RepID=UPI001C76F40F|nr:hypothetical protein [Pseudomonas sp. AO-1]QXZ11706.1 hypothetical protein KVQ82_16580 [Pseudomonas sp. AO-1]
MSEVKRYHVGDKGLVEGVSLGRISVVLGADYDTAISVGTALGSSLGRVVAERDALQLLLNERDEQLDAQRLRANTAESEVKRLEALLNTPHTAGWFEGVKLEAGHQIQRWGSDHYAGKGPADWFWLIGYLAQKAMTSQMLGNEEKAKHHTISTGAALLNWFRAITGDSNVMRPGIDDAALNPNPEAEIHDRNN